MFTPLNNHEVTFIYLAPKVGKPVGSGPLRRRCRGSFDRERAVQEGAIFLSGRGIQSSRVAKEEPTAADLVKPLSESHAVRRGFAPHLYHGEADGDGGPQCQGGSKTLQNETALTTAVKGSLHCAATARLSCEPQRGVLERFYNLGTALWKEDIREQQLVGFSPALTGANG
ncbi:hypothetical protein AAFF_G00243810 [Aldrovandia affinis]|uniref:Uncharacterized protein n=1 Tax=Aldrovandia affinis TaxID=143900 RepID=A0AAD7RE53_9TELE|nr:hypothetical protein AAFF_G00243810 [Aldrovandia affinis]